MSWTDWNASQTAATFLAVLPEFTNCPAALITARIAMATERTPLDIWNTLQGQGILYLAADMLTMLPGSKEMRLEGGGSVYGIERKRLEGIVSSGFRVAGIPTGTDGPGYGWPSGC